MKILLIKNKRLYSYSLPKDIKDNFWINDIDSFDNERNLINIEAYNGKWTLVSNYDTHIIGANNTVYDRVEILEYQFYTIRNDNEKTNYYLYAIPDIEKTYNSYKIVTNGELLIGRGQNCSIVYQSNIINDIQAKLEYNNGLWQITDNNTSFGIYVKINMYLK